MSALELAAHRAVSPPVRTSLYAPHLFHLLLELRELAQDLKSMMAICDLYSQCGTHCVTVTGWDDYFTPTFDLGVHIVGNGQCDPSARVIVRFGEK